MITDLLNGQAIAPTEASLRDYFKTSAQPSPPPIDHPESLAFREHCRQNQAYAAVLIPIICANQALDVLLTKRADHLRHHPGQTCFPGGRIELEDATPVAAALRETHEEIGVPASKIEVLGRLGDYYTFSGFCVTPTVALISESVELTLDPGEVADTLQVPLNFLMDPSVYHLQSRIHQGQQRRYFSTHYQQQQIWGVTAGIIMALYQGLLATHAT